LQNGKPEWSLDFGLYILQIWKQETNFDTGSGFESSRKENVWSYQVWPKAHWEKKHLRVTTHKFT